MVDVDYYRHGGILQMVLRQKQEELRETRGKKEITKGTKDNPVEPRINKWNKE